MVHEDEAHTAPQQVRDRFPLSSLRTILLEQFEDLRQLQRFLRLVHQRVKIIRDGHLHDARPAGDLRLMLQS